MFMVVSGRRDTARSGTDGSMYRAMKRRVRRSEPKTRRSRGRDDRGAVLVEAAFMLPFLVALLLGIIDVQALRLPHDNSHSAALSREAAPVLRREALEAQTSHIDVVSGATLTSESYVESLQGALDRAGH